MWGASMRLKARPHEGLDTSGGLGKGGMFCMLLGEYLSTIAATYDRKLVSGSAYRRRDALNIATSYLNCRFRT